MEDARRLVREGVPARDAGPPPACPCHGELMVWQMDRRYLAGGYWRCRPAMNDRSRTRYAANPQPRRDQVNEYHLIRGWKVKRLRDLGQQREQVIRKLEGTDA